MIPKFNLKTMKDQMRRQKIPSPPPIIHRMKTQFWEQISQLEKEGNIKEQMARVRNSILFPIFFDDKSYEEHTLTSEEEIFQIDGQLFQSSSNLGDDFVDYEIKGLPIYTYFQPHTLYIDSNYIQSYNPEADSSFLSNWIPIGTFKRRIPLIQYEGQDFFFYINLARHEEFLQLNQVGQDLREFLVGVDPEYLNPERFGKWEIISSSDKGIRE